MNRRSFFSTLLKGAAAFTILPSAGRVWKATREVFPVRMSERYFTFEELHALRADLLDSLGPYVPTFQDFLAAAQRSSKYEIEAMAELLTEPKVWPPNMGETKILVYGTTNNIARSVVQSSEPNSRPIYVGTLFPT